MNKVSEPIKNQCNGMRRYGGAFTLGSPQWVQCEENGTVSLTIDQGGKETTLAACNTCWKECVENNLNILKVTPL